MNDTFEESDIDKAYRLMQSAAPGERDAQAILTLLMPLAKRNARVFAAMCRNQPLQQLLDKHAFLSTAQLALVRMVNERMIYATDSTQFENYVKKVIRSRCKNLIRDETGNGNEPIPTSLYFKTVGADGKVTTSEKTIKYNGSNENDFVEANEWVTEIIKNSPLSPGKRRILEKEIERSQSEDDQKVAASELGIPEGTYKSGLFKARSIVKRQLNTERNKGL